VGVRASYKSCKSLPGSVEVVGVGAAPRDEPKVFFAPYGGAYAVISWHYLIPSLCDRSFGFYFF
jgi:hypothetical protein